VGLSVGLWLASSYIERNGETNMDAIENIALIVVLMALGIAATWAVLIGLIYFFEVTND
jgi:prolipoprotein diacylglyceryltransferase